jgi:hypothetical protein
MAPRAAWRGCHIGGFVAASTEVLIGDPSVEHALIRPVSRSNPGLFDDRDGNWIECEVEVVAGGFRGAFTADMRSEEFQAFMDQLSELGRTIDGAATFTTMEGQLTLSLTAEASGQIRVAGEALDLAGSGNRLAFGFDVDPTHLSSIARSLQALLAAFPVIDAPDA